MAAGREAQLGEARDELGVMGQVAKSVSVDEPPCSWSPAAVGLAMMDSSPWGLTA